MKVYYVENHDVKWPDIGVTLIVADKMSDVTFLLRKMMMAKGLAYTGKETITELYMEEPFAVMVQSQVWKEKVMEKALQMEAEAQEMTEEEKRNRRLKMGF